MSTAILNNLTRVQLTKAVRQIVDSVKFWDKNSHVPYQHQAHLRSEILVGRWPDFPLFSPYAITHDGYSQGMSFHPIPLQLHFSNLASFGICYR